MSSEGLLLTKNVNNGNYKFQDMQNDGSEMIVKSVKGGCAEGLVVGGGGKNGIFIKEVKPESPASKHLSVKEGEILCLLYDKCIQESQNVVSTSVSLAYSFVFFPLIFQVIRYLVPQYTLIMCHMKMHSRFLSMRNHTEWSFV